MLAHSGYDFLPYGPTAIGNGRFVLTPRINARKHAANLERLRAAVNEARRLKGFEPTGIRVLSWARSFVHNSVVGGAPNSQHLYFLATDIALQEIERLCPWATGRETFDDLLDKVFAQGGIGFYPAGNRHCDSRGHRARWTNF